MFYLPIDPGKVFVNQHTQKKRILLKIFTSKGKFTFRSDIQITLKSNLSWKPFQILSCRGNRRQSTETQMISLSCFRHSKYFPLSLKLVLFSKDINVHKHIIRKHHDMCFACLEYILLRVLYILAIFLTLIIKYNAHKFLNIWEYFISFTIKFIQQHKLLFYSRIPNAIYIT